MKKWYFPVAMTILAVFLALFLFPGNLIDTRRIILGTQFSGLVTRLGPYLLLALSVLVAGMLFGRLYCAYLCPAGLLQHLFTHIGKKLKLAKLQYRPALPWLSYTIMAVVSLYIILYGASFFLGPIPGFAIFVQPLGEAIRRGHFRTVRFLSDHPEHITTLAVLFVAFVALPLFRGRVFCNRVCPVGILLGWVNRLPGMRFRIDPDACKSCGKCAKACPVGCVDASAKNIEAERCVECYDCVNVCSFDAIRKTWGKSADRRSFLSGGVAAALGSLFVFSRVLTKPGGVLGSAAAGEVPVAPPGSGGDDQHRLRCIGCQACVPACPVGILLPQDGRPVLDFHHGYCQYNCNECSRSCPAGAIEPVGLEEKHRIRLAQIHFNPYHCVAVVQNSHCGACAEVCPTHAVSMIENENGGPPVPDFNPAYCIGCGGCYHVCPEQGKAFTLDGLKKHELAEGVRLMDAQEQAEPGEDGELTDFPF